MLTYQEALFLQFLQSNPSIFHIDYIWESIRADTWYLGMIQLLLGATY